MDESTTGREAPRVDCERLHPGLAVADLSAAVAFYTAKLGFRHEFTWGDPPTMAGVALGNTSVHLFENGSPGSASVFFVVGDADELFEFQRASGAEILVPPGDRDYEMRDYRVRDLDGNELAFGHYVYGVGPKVEIERVDVPVRLEKRLAGLLHDLAEHKRMSLSSCLEEILLHTCEPLGDGVASPHTTRTLRHIQELKVKHGISYDCHASYRFVEK